MTGPLGGGRDTRPLGKAGPAPRPAAAAGRPAAAPAPRIGADGLALGAALPARAPGDPDPAAIRAAIRAYAAGYRPGPLTCAPGRTPDDQDSLPYVKAHDPLRGRVAAGGFTAAVSLGVDPGLFYCGGLVQVLADRAKAKPGLATGFIHLPPDRSTEAAKLAAPSAGLPTRAQNLEMAAEVVGKALGGLADQRPGKPLTVLLTGFGPFQDAEDNPTLAFLREPSGAAAKARLDAVMRHAFGFEPAPGNPEALPGPGGRPLGYRYQVDGRAIDLMTGVFQVASTEGCAREGRYDQTMDQLRTQAAALEKAAGRAAGRAPDVVIGLGVDGSQLDNADPADTRYLIETQSRGFFAELSAPDGTPVPHRDRRFDEARPTPNPALAEAYMLREARGR